MSWRYWWLNMRQEVMDYVQGCAECQRNKINTQPTKAPLSPIFPTRKAMPFETIALDFITKLPISQGYDSILTVTDHDCTKAAVFIPCKESMMAEETTGLIIQHVMIRTLRVMGLVLPQYVITSYRFRLFPLSPLLYYYPIPVLSMITHRLTCFDCVCLCPTLWCQLCDRLSI